jgi:DNA (cytosine-5)-methyltransferase 1
MTRPRLLDLFCGAGGAAMGYFEAGFEVVGVDIRSQPHYPFEFHQADALKYPLDGYDAVHASPPCQAYSIATRNWGTTSTHPDLLGSVRERLQQQPAPWVIENVPGAPMRADYKLCGCMFGLRSIRRQRLFETSWAGFAMAHGHDHSEPSFPIVGHGLPPWSRRQFGREPTPDEKRMAMGIDWMTTWELAEAIPPAYTRFVGEQLLQHLGAAA